MELICLGSHEKKRAKKRQKELRLQLQQMAVV
jgi:hypothetical protein